MKRFALTLLTLGLLFGFARPASADLVVNGGFESGTFSGWTQSGNLGFTEVNSVNVHSGRFSAEFGPVGSLGFISQNLATTPGTEYILDFWLQNDGGVPNEWLVRVGGDTLRDVVNAPGFGYTEFTFDFTATSTSTALQFGFENNPAFYHLDDVSVNAAPVPEPTTLTLAAIGGILAGMGLRRRRKAAAV